MEFEVKGLTGFIDDKFVVGIQENGLPCTIFGRTYYNKTSGYLKISNGENNQKRLHRLIYCYIKGLDYSNKDIVIHHNNKNKIDNKISNLEALSRAEHNKIHKTGENHPMYNKKHSDLTKFKTSLSISIFKYNNLPFRVSFGLNNGYESYTYAYKDSNGVHRFIKRQSLDDLKKIVISRDLLWLETKQEMIDLYEELGGEIKK